GEKPSPPQFRPFLFPAVRIEATSAILNRSSIRSVSQGSISESNLGAYITMNHWAGAEVATLAIERFIEPPQPPPPNPSAVLPPPDPGIFALRTHVGLFGNNAPRYTSLLAPTGQGFPKGTGGFLYPNDWDANGFEIWKDSMSQPAGYYQDADVYLEQAVPGIVRDSWIVLEQPTSNPIAYRVGVVIESALAGFGLSGRVTGLRLTQVDGSSEITIKPSSFLVRKTVPYAQSEALDLADLPIPDDLEPGDTQVMLNGLYLGLEPGQPVALTGL